MIELNEALVGRGTVLGDCAQHSIKGLPFRLTQIFALQKLLLWWNRYTPLTIEQIRGYVDVWKD